VSVDLIITDDGPTVVLVVGEGQGPEGVPGVGVGEVHFPVALLASTLSVAFIPAGSRVFYAALSFGTAYDPGTQFSVGNATTPTALMVPADSAPASPNPFTYEVSLDVDWVLGAPVLVSIAGSPTHGAAICLVRYTTPLA
jgi:hypothetical protein